MQRLNDRLLEQIDETINLKSKSVLEIGCGNGSKSSPLAKLCAGLTAIDPDKDAIADVNKNHAANNLAYEVGKAENLNFHNNSFDVIIFNLSLHHVLIPKMSKAIGEAVRVCKQDGRILCVEPSFNGTFFDAEVRFDSCDGDERKEKAAAHYELLKSKILHEDLEFYTDVQFRFNDDADFVNVMLPKQSTNELRQFLAENNYELKAQRRVNIYKPIKISNK